MRISDWSSDVCSSDLPWEQLTTKSPTHKNNTTRCKNREEQTMSAKASGSHLSCLSTFNRLLSTLTSQELGRIRHELVPVNWKVDQILVEPLDPMYYVWFPETCVVSLSVALEQGVTCEAGIIGSDGVVGYEAFLGNDLALSRHVVQEIGRAPQQIGRAHV